MKNLFRALLRNVGPTIFLGVALFLSPGTPRTIAATNDQASATPDAAGVSKHAINPSPKYPPTPGFEKFAITDTSKFYQTQAFSVFDASAGYLKNIQFNYVYRDVRYAKVDSYNCDVSLQVFEFASPEKAKAYLKKKTAGAIPAAKAGTVKLPACKGEKRANDDFWGPSIIVKTIHHPNGSDIVVMHSGDFNTFDCKGGNNHDENMRWVDGAYYFEVGALPMSKIPNDDAKGRAEEFALDYLAALGQAVTP